MKTISSLQIKMVLIALFTLFSVNIFAQVTVTGTVLDDLGEGAAGATVREKGTQNGAATDVNGKFQLKVKSGKATLVVSYIGFETQEVALSGRTNVTIKLKSDDQLLSETVVIAYGTQKKVTLTGAVANVGGDDLVKAPVGNLGNALQGQLPGVQTVQYSGMPGADDPVIRVRGIGTLNNANPLVLVDGVERSFTQLDPNEVESISILKDASATAVFGVRGANGVILVTTKRGKTGKASVSVSASAAIQQISDYIDFADSYTYGRMWNYAKITDVLPTEFWPGTTYIDDYSALVPNYKDKEGKPHTYEDLGCRFNQQAMQHFKKGDMPMAYPNVNWMDYIMKDAAWQEQVNVNVSGGTDKVRYFISTGVFNQSSLFKTFSNNPDETFKYNRYNYRANLDIDVSKYSTLSVTLGGRVENRTTLGQGEEFIFRYLQGATPYSSYGIDDEGRLIVSDERLVGPYDRAPLTNYYKLGYNKASRNVLNFDLQYKHDMSWLTEGLSFSVKASYNSTYNAEKSMKSGYGTGTQYVATIVDGQEVLRKEGVAWPATYSENNYVPTSPNGRDWYAEASFNYSRKFGLHNVGALILYNQSKSYYPLQFVDKPSGYVGLVGRVTYDYDLRYLFDFNIGYNGSENFAPGKRYGTFPSFSAGWIPSNEKFWESIKEAVGYLKLRASWGKVGNDKMGNYRFMYLPGPWGFYDGHMSGNPLNSGTNFGTNPGSEDWLKAAKELSMGNPDVTWEVATKINLGLDAHFIDDKLALNLDFFWENRKDILVGNDAMLPAVTSLPSSRINRGKMKNHGFEINLEWNDKIGNVRYHISPSFTFARNKVVDMLEVPPMYDYLAYTGKPWGTHMVYELFEFYNEGTEKRYKEKYGVDMPNQNVPLKYGDCIYVDLNGDGQIDTNDRHEYGYTDIPEINYSLNVGLQWKGLDFSMLWVGADHVNRMLNTYYRAQFGSTYSSALTQWVADNSWTEDNQDAILPRISFDNGNNTLDSRAWLTDTKYIRLKNIEIGYTINKPKFVPILNSVRFFANAQNLLTFTDFKGNDPEADGGNYQYGIKYPMTRVFNFGVKVNF